MTRENEISEMAEATSEIASMFDLSNVDDLPESLRPKRKGRKTNDETYAEMVKGAGRSVTLAEFKGAYWRKFGEEISDANVTNAFRRMVEAGMLVKKDHGLYIHADNVGK